MKKLWMIGTVLLSFATPAQGYVPVVTPGVPKLEYKLVDGVKVFNLTAEEVITTFHDGFNPGGLKVWGYNGSMPGPTIEVVEGDKVRIIFENHLPEPTTIHWHGLEVPNNMDGAPDHPVPPVQPGKGYVYEFTLHQNGTFMYHSEFMPSKQVGMGLTGLFIVHPKVPFEPAVQKDYAFTLQTWVVPAHSNIPDMMSHDFNYFTMNGKAGPAIPSLDVKYGERVRIRIANNSMMDHPIHIHGHTFWVTGTGSGRIPQTAWIPDNTVGVSAGQIRDFEFVANNPGTWMFHCHYLHHIMNDMDKPPLPGEMDHSAHGPGGMHTMIRVSNPDGSWPTGGNHP